MMLSLIVILVGFSGLIAQTLLLRELLVTFNGNELNVGIILASWVIAETIGVVTLAKLFNRRANGANYFVLLQLLFSAAMPVSIYFARATRDLLGFNFGEGIGILAVFLISFIITLPLGFSHGALFSTLYKIYTFAPDKTGAHYFAPANITLQPEELHSGSIEKTDLTAGRVYSFETLGTLLGGVVFTFLFIPYLNSFQIVFLISILNLISCLSFLFKMNRALRFCVLFFLFTFIIATFVQGIGALEKISLQKAWKNQQLMDSRNSVYGNVAVTKILEQYTFFYNGIPVITTPFPDRQFVEDLGHLPLFFHPAPKEILVLGSGAGGLINEILKHPVQSLDYVELDPLLIEMLNKYPTALTAQELNNPKVKTINIDGRFYLKNLRKRYDLILIGASCHEDLASNRFFTQEFFSLAKRSLKEGGILAFWLPGSFTYLPKELVGLNASILNALRKVYPYVRIIPGEYNIFLASTFNDIMEVNSEVIIRRKATLGIENTNILAGYLNYRLDKRWIAWFTASLAKGTDKINRDFSPIAVFEMVKLVNKKFSKGITNFLEIAGSIPLTQAIFFVFLLTAFIYISSRRKNSSLAVVYSIATTGFFGMMGSLILMFCFQVIRGYLYHSLGLLISLFMAGAAAGAMFVSTKLSVGKKELRLLVLIEAIIALFSFSLGFILTKFMPQASCASLMFWLLFFICGLLMGAEFPLGVKLYGRDILKYSSAVGIIYAADLIGACLAGIFGGIILIPALGILNTCIIIFVIKISSLLLLLLFSGAN